MGSDKFCLRWNDFETNISGAFKELRDQKNFFDVTLAIDDNPAHTLQAHKVILAACSPFFRNALLRQGALSGLGPGFAQPNPLVYLRGVSYQDMCHILDFMYHGEVNVAQEDLNSFLAVAEDLKIKGLTSNDNPSGANAAGPSSVKREPHKREAPPDRENGSAKKRPRPALATPQVPDEDTAGPSHVELDDAEAGPSNIKAEVLPEENYEATDDYAGEDDSYYDEGAYEGGEDMGGVGGAAGDESKGLQQGSTSEAAATIREVQEYFNKMSIRTASGGFQCLVCATVTRDFFNVRTHLLTHLFLTNKPLEEKIERIIKPYIIQQDSSSYSCLICRKVLKLRFKRVKDHFCIKHFK